jgi:exodeoxyribonuclease V alpha subunit
MWNDYERDVFNGELGVVKQVDDDGIVVSFGDRGTRNRRFKKSSLAKRDQGPAQCLDWGNVITVHKAQGSEFPVVIVPVLKTYTVMLLRNLYYTAVSRAQKRVIIVGDPEALKWAANNLSGKHRVTKLAEFLTPRRIGLPARRTSPISIMRNGIGLRTK